MSSHDQRFGHKGNSFLGLTIEPIIRYLVSIFLVWIIGKKLWQKRQQRLAKAQLPSIQPLRNFDWRGEEPKQLRPFKSVYNITMAIQSDNLSDLITIDRDYLDRATLRRSIISRYKNTVYGYLPGGETATRELYSYLLTHHLPIRFPEIFRTSGKRFFENLITTRSFPLKPPQDPGVCLQIIAETVEEDIFLLKETETTYVCLAFTCCFPTGFDPSTKLGQSLEGIHAPVPSYDKIAPSMERFFRKLEVGKSVKRMNWNIQTGSDLINVSGNHIKDGEDFVVDEDVDHSQARLRVELQSLTRLPQSRFILFCFKTYLYPLQDIKAEGSGPALADAIEGLQKGNAPGMFKYKSAVRWGKSVASYLRS